MHITHLLRTALCLLALLTCGLSARATEQLQLVFIGNSITWGAWLEHRDIDAPPAETARVLARETGREVVFRNCAVSGLTTLNFVPASGEFFHNVVAAADTLTQHRGELIFSISLGTNDSACSGTWGAPVAKEQYYTNLKAIIDELLFRFPKAKIVVQSPIWYSENTYNGATYLKAGLERLNSYRPMIVQLVNDCATRYPHHVYLGDTEAYAWFEGKTQYYVPEQGNAGTFYLHPNLEGAHILGQFWARAMLKIWQ